eukprot:TRINITY_DN703_c0_g1_i1.p1 TRINITY_DN703_c0_g1~~TRINITY_DN703_c0_g1_i1.p1  ORF type:complete len:404 (+),score=94.90 TRINITY_DN703_c0_g1_i1:79-1290(+)
MPVEMEYYEILGVSGDAEETQIKRAYKRMALKYHPDKCKEADGEQKFKQVAEAYEVLSDADKRSIYDKHGKKGLEEGGGMPGGMDASDIFSAFFGGGKPRGEKKPKDIVHELSVSLEDFYNGRTRKIAATRDRLCEPCGHSGVDKACGKSRDSFKCGECDGKGAKVVLRELAPGFVQQAQVVCPKCQGQGFSIPSQFICKDCDGKRVVKERKVLEVHIEKGMKQGDHVLFDGEGDQIPGLKLSGNILIMLGHKPHDFFQRRGRHLFIEQEITLNEALCGFTLPIQHLDGRELLVKTRPGQVLDPQQLWVIDREGMPVKGTGGCEKGSLVVNLKVKFPDKISDAQKKAIHAALGEPETLPLKPEHEECFLAAFEQKRQQRRQQRGHGHHHGHGGGGQTAQCSHQ